MQVFDHVADLVECLKVIQQDEQVRKIVPEPCRAVCPRAAMQGSNKEIIVGAEPVSGLQIVIVRVKNRLDKNYDASLSLGYRDVAINLRVLADEAFNLGVDSHVCELQLILHKVAKNKSESGHRRYVEFRDARYQAVALTNNTLARNSDFRSDNLLRRAE